MAEKRGMALDWVTIRYKDIYTIIGIAVAVLVLGGGGFLFWRWHGNPQVQADRQLSKAERLLETLDKPATPVELRATLNQVRGMLKEGRGEYKSQHYKKALSIADDSLKTLRDAQAAAPKSQKFAVLVDVDGSVEVKRTGQHLFAGAKEQMILEDGDILRTAQKSFARIKYHNGQVQIVNPDSLVVIQLLSTSPDGANHIEVALKQGDVETRTPETMSKKDQSVITTESTRVRPAPASRVKVRQEPGGEVMTSVFTGATEVEAAGQRTELQAGATGVSIVSSSAGIADRFSLIAPPAPIFPMDQQILRVDDPPRHPITFAWRPGTGDRFHFQISAKPLFSSTLAPDQIVRGDKVTLDGLPAGTYYWRLKATGDESKTYWSPIYRFRLLQIFQRPKIKRDLKLVVEATPIGDGLILQGSTDPGVNVSVNDIEIPVNTDGSFSKITLFTDVGTQSVQVRAFDDEGNEKIWRKQFRSRAY